MGYTYLHSVGSHGLVGKYLPIPTDNGICDNISFVKNFKTPLRNCDYKMGKRQGVNLGSGTYWLWDLRCNLPQTSVRPSVIRIGPH